MERDRWIEQARFLAAGDTAGFERVFGRLRRHRPCVPASCARLTNCDATSQPLIGRSGNSVPATITGTDVIRCTQTGGSNATCSHTTKKISGSAMMHSEKKAGPSSGAAKR
ncbi:hypothetical protein WR25_19059 [Diploscapter pachys]|uniref:Uncharacterized protein n=1 Tax=Diploscapter pachys TaxID=2018661 RepID=A0A2A2JYI8_9BILA|nr:hypothetical protein WR25_19059 [Diploscapter pachys]